MLSQTDVSAHRAFLNITTRKGGLKYYRNVTFKAKMKVHTLSLRSMDWKSSLNIKLTTALLSGGWVPVTSGSSHYWKPSHWQWKRGGRGKNRGLQGAKISNKRLCHENAIDSRSTWNPGTCAHINTAGHRATLVLFVVNSVKLHLSTLKAVLRQLSHRTTLRFCC